MPELGSISDKQIAALAGVAPINNDSGQAVGKRSIKGGRYNVRCMLYQAALVASTHNQHLKAFAKRLKENGKPHKVILIADCQEAIGNCKYFGDKKPALASNLRYIRGYSDTSFPSRVLIVKFYNLVGYPPERTSRLLVSHVVRMV